MKVYSSNLIDCLIKSMLSSVEGNAHLVDWQIIVEDKTYLKIIYRLDKKEQESLRELS